MYQEDIQWFNQTLLTYKDKRYGTDGYLRLSISTNTSDFTTFNAPTFLISISNNYQKMLSLNLDSAIDLIQTFDKAASTIKSNGGFKEFQIDRKINGSILSFKIFENKDYNEVISKIEIVTNETDLRTVILPLKPTLQTCIRCIRYFVDNYFQLCTNLMMKSIDSKERNIINQIPSLIKGLYSSNFQVTNLDCRASDATESNIDEDVVKKSEGTIEDLDRFLGEDMENIKVAELEDKKIEEITKNEVLYTPFIEKVLNYDLRNLENMLRNATMGNTPILDLAKEIEKRIDLNEDFDALPNLKDDDLKSLLYLSKLFSSFIYQNNLENNIPIPPTNPIFKYNPATYSENNVDIANDLFVCGLYIRCLRRKLEDKIKDVETNKSLFQLYFRCFLDPFVFSYIRKDNKLPSIAVARFKAFDEAGVFNHYKNLLELNSLPQITSREIAESANEANEKALVSGQLIFDLHKQAYEGQKVRIAAENNFSLEQITNEIIPLEVLEKIGKNINSIDEIKEILPDHEFSKEILDFFLKNKPVSKKKDISKSGLFRFIEKFKNDIPERYRDDFLKFIEENSDKKFDFTNSKFQLDEFGDEIIKALYIWDPEGNPIMKTNYKQFTSTIMSEIMTKELILSKYDEDSSELKEEDKGYGDLMNYIGE